MMKKKNILIIIFRALMFILCLSCHRVQGIFDENDQDVLAKNLQKVIEDFVSENDFYGFVRFEDSLYTIKTCLSAALYDIDTNHYLTLIISRYSGDPLEGTVRFHPDQITRKLYKVCGKDLFVYSHTVNSTQSLFPPSTCSDKTFFEKEKEYSYDGIVIDCKYEMQTYKYRLSENDVWIEKDTSFNLFQWLYPDL